MLIELPVCKIFELTENPGKILARAVSVGSDQDTERTIKVFSNNMLVQQHSSAETKNGFWSVTTTPLNTIEIQPGRDTNAILQFQYTDNFLVAVYTNIYQPCPYYFSFDKNSLVVFTTPSDYSRYKKKEPVLNSTFIYPFLIDCDALLPHSPYKDIFTIPIGQNLAISADKCVLTPSKIQVQQQKIRTLHFDDVASDILECLKRCPTDSAILLSGGLDSSLLALVSNSDQRTKKLPLIHFIAREGATESEETHAQKVAQYCSRELTVVDHTTDKAVLLDTDKSLYWPSKQFVFNSRLNHAQSVSNCNNFIDGNGGRALFFDNPRLGLLLKNSIGSRQELIHNLARTNDRVYFSMLRKLEAVLVTRFSGNSAIAGNVLEQEYTYGLEIGTRDRAAIVKEISRIVSNFTSSHRNADFWFNVLIGLSMKKRELMSNECRLFSPLRDWQVISSTIPTSAKQHFHPQHRNFQRNLIRHLSDCPIADRDDTVEHVGYRQTLLHKNRELIRSLVNGTLSDFPVFRENFLAEQLERSRFDSEETLSDLVSLSYFLQQKKHNETALINPNFNMQFSQT